VNFAGAFQSLKRLCYDRNYRLWGGALVFLLRQLCLLLVWRFDDCPGASDNAERSLFMTDIGDAKV
jgi:hypothetical protein